MLLFAEDKEMQFVTLQVEVRLLWWEQIYSANCETTDGRVDKMCYET